MDLICATFGIFLLFLSVICTKHKVVAQTTYDIRLSNGNTAYEGRVEIFYNGEWGTVCDDGWSLDDATVVCRQLGYAGAAAAYQSAYFGQGYGTIWLDDVNCYGYESSLSDCAHNGWGFHNCGHGEDASVTCYDYDYTDVEVRLVDGAGSYEGRVEVRYYGIWGTICDDGWDIDDATVVCRQLGFDGAEAAYQSAYFGAGIDTIWLDDVNCIGNENSLEECVHAGVGSHNCGHHEDASVKCITDSIDNPNTLSIRLAGGTNSYHGRVEIENDGEWGTVCDDSWDINDAEVVCRQLGFSGVEASYQNAYFGQGSGPIWLDNVDCDGHESYLTACSHNGLENHNCRHSEDAGVQCSGGGSDDVRLRGGSDDRGRVEVYSGGVWGTVCDDGWTFENARVVCRSLGFAGVKSYQVYDIASGTGVIWLDNVACDGSESSLRHCSHNGWGNTDCSHANDVAVECYSEGFSTWTIVGIVCGSVIGGFFLLHGVIKGICNHSKNKTRNSTQPTGATSQPASNTRTDILVPSISQTVPYSSYNQSVHLPAHQISSAWTTDPPPSSPPPAYADIANYSNPPEFNNRAGIYSSSATSSNPPSVPPYSTPLSSSTSPYPSTEPPKYSPPVATSLYGR